MSPHRSARARVRALWVFLAAACFLAPGMPARPAAGQSLDGMFPDPLTSGELTRLADRLRLDAKPAARSPGHP